MSRQNPYTPTIAPCRPTPGITRSIRWAATRFQLLGFTFLMSSALTILFIAVDAEMRSRGLPPEIPLLAPIFDNGVSSLILSLLAGLVAAVLMITLLTSVHYLKTMLWASPPSDGPNGL